VTHEVEPHSIVGGVPAKPLKSKLDIQKDGATENS
jgi:acetyltransferase-like isoleucine patch superfamily enzyme